MLSLLFVYTLGMDSLAGQGNHDYDPWPDMRVSYSGLTAELRFESDRGVLIGSAVYALQVRHDQVNSLSIPAAVTKVFSVKLNDRPIDYDHSSNHLLIRFEDALSRDQAHTLAITWEADPLFGIHRLPSGTIFSSNLPGSVSHWLPGPVHPRTALPVRLTLDVPAGWTAVASGRMREVETVAGRRQYRWNTVQPVPLSDLAFAMGEFSYADTFIGTKSLRIYYEQQSLGDQQANDLLHRTARMIREMERHLQSELPATAIHVIVLDDDRWETRPYAAGTTYAFMSQGDLSVQILRSLIAQWFGISLRPVQWNDADFAIWLQAMAAEQMNAEEWQITQQPLESFFDIPVSLYERFHMNYWQWARQHIRNNRSESFYRMLDESVHRLSDQNGAWLQHHFSENLYEETGLYKPVPVLEEPDPPTYLKFEVVVTEARATNRIDLAITPLGDIVEGEFAFTLHWEREGRVFEKEIRFSGKGDSKSVDPDGYVSNVWISASGKLDHALTIKKPFSFWLHQLRRSEDPSRRREAALALRDFVSDPDLQLALQDIRSNETDPLVLAAIYQVMADITAGASGTERLFIEGTASSDPGMALASMEALSAYKNNQRVTEHVRQIIQTSDHIALVNQAITTYRHLKDEADFRSFAIQFLDEDRQDLLFTRTLLDELFSIPVKPETIDAAKEYLNISYSFDLRWSTYQLLRTHAPDGGWQRDFLKEKSTDPDPRIRYIAYFSLMELPAAERESFLQIRMLNEYDLRILRLIQDLKTSL